MFLTGLFPYRVVIFWMAFRIRNTSLYFNWSDMNYFVSINQVHHYCLGWFHWFLTVVRYFHCFFHRLSSYIAGPSVQNLSVQVLTGPPRLWRYWSEVLTSNEICINSRDEECHNQWRQRFVMVNASGVLMKENTIMWDFIDSANL